ncbi:hypothetical protein KHQ06_24120 [Nocardia tengchongensis]|uniref:Uncharacterized protein n=1 Tax=Nocardia tengchongensis TaxID=2055889 RepID=A0ABX8CZT3_9NOCA|nr:hypothetical protein [Nocardia tengchongensis]QVI25421.1 hypothetical protein KHQ06_24120 [Nocardia tengchongensis]
MSTSAVPPDRQQLIDDVALSKYMMDDLDPDDPKWDEHYSGLRDWLHATFAVGAMTGVVFGDDDVVAEVFRAYNALVEDRAHAPSVRYTNEYLAAGIARARALMDACPDPGCESLCHRLQGRVDLLMAMQRARAIP